MRQAVTLAKEMRSSTPMAQMEGAPGLYSPDEMNSFLSEVFRRQAAKRNESGTQETMTEYKEKNDAFKAEAIRGVNDNGGCKGVALITDILFETRARVDPVELLEEIVNDGGLVEVEYELPGTDRIKSFFLPAGTVVRVRGS